MELKELIYRRKSVRSYTGVPVDGTMIDRINALAADLKPLYPQINVRWEIVSKEKVKCFLPWTTPQLITIFSEEKEGYLENIGFMFQQLDLYLQSMGLGVCWLGMGRLSSESVLETTQNDGMKYVIMLAFGHPKGNALREGAGEFKRRSLSEISDKTDDRLEPARVAPSSVNSQPWYFTHEDDKIHVYCAYQGIFRPKSLSYMNQIDIGIALAHMYVAYPDTFKFFRSDNVQPVKGHAYLGSFTI